MTGVQTCALPILPKNNEQLTIWYEARLPQTAADSRLSTSINVIPRHLPPHLYVVTTGSGSQEEGFPYPQAYVQTGGVYPGSSGTFSGDHELSARATLSTAFFSAATGFLRLPTIIPFVPTADGLTFNRNSPGDTDIEGRTFFSSVTGGSYLPNTFAANLSDPMRHKVIYPFLAELTTTSSLGIKGQLVLVVLSRWALLDSTNGVYFDTDLTQSTTSASVFRLKGNLLTRRA